MAPIVSDEKSAINLIEDHLYIMSCFSFADFKIISLSLDFDSLIIICLSVDFSAFMLLGVCSACFVC
jgi:hypothetical protein